MLLIFCETLMFSGVSATEDNLKLSTVLDSGKCGDTLYWELNSEGVLRIFGEGAMYDYNKYYEPSPWYKYRDEPYISEDGTYILNSNGTEYLPTKEYYDDNPNNYKVSSIVIEPGITYIGDWAFYRVCVDEITVPEGVESTGIFCFRYSPKLKELTLPDSLKILDDFAISRNYVLTTINLGNGLEKVGAAGFHNNPALESLVLPESCTSVGEQMSPTFGGINYKAVGLIENCRSLQTIGFGSVDKIPQRALLEAGVKEVIIPNTVKSIDEYAFYNCSSLEKVVFESGSVCTNIDATAFQGCNKLKSVTGGTALESMGRYALISTLEEFQFSSTNKTLEKQQFMGTSLKKVTVSEGITEIPVSCFNSMSMLEEIHLPASLTEFKGSSFNHCSSLTDIYYGDTLAEWNKIVKADGWSYGVNANCVVHFFDGKTAMLKDIHTKVPESFYTVTFANDDGNILSTQYVASGNSAVAPDSPAKESDAQYSYTFAGWDKSFDKIASDITVTAVYTKKVNTFTVRFLDFDGSVLNVQTVEYGASAATIDEPIRDGYIFTGWDKDITFIKADTDVLAQYKEILPEYGIIKVEVEGGTCFKVSVNSSVERPMPKTYESGKIPAGTEICVTAFSSAGNEFFGWINSENGEVLSSELTYNFKVTSDCSIKAVFSTIYAG